MDCLLHLDLKKLLLIQFMVAAGAMAKALGACAQLNFNSVARLEIKYQPFFLFS